MIPRPKIVTKDLMISLFSFHYIRYFFHYMIFTVYFVFFIHFIVIYFLKQLIPTFIFQLLKAIFASIIFISFFLYISRNILPISVLYLPYIIYLLYFSENTIWYCHLHFVCIKLSMSLPIQHLLWFIVLQLSVAFIFIGVFSLLRAKTILCPGIASGYQSNKNLTCIL